MHSRRLMQVHIHVALCALLSQCDCLRSMSASDIGFLVYATCVNVFKDLVSFSLPQYKHTNACRIHRYETLSMHHIAPNAKLCQIFAVKMGHLFAVFSQRKLGENSILCTMTHLTRKCCWISTTKIRQNVAGFLPWKFGNNSKCDSKTLIKATPLSKIKPQIPILLKPQKLMPIAYF